MRLDAILLVQPVHPSTCCSSGPSCFRTLLFRRRTGPICLREGKPSGLRSRRICARVSDVHCCRDGRHVQSSGRRRKHCIQRKDRRARRTWANSKKLTYQVYALDFTVPAGRSYSISVSGPISAQSPVFAVDLPDVLYPGLLVNTLFFYQTQRSGRTSSPMHCAPHPRTSRTRMPC